MTIKEPISTIIWDIKYRYRRQDRIIDKSIEDTWRRVAEAVSQAEIPSERDRWANEFYRILEGYQFLPGGRILAGAGTSHKVTLLNCFVMNIAEDSIPAIFKALSEGAITLQQGGGVGYDFSVLRPRGQYAKTTGNPSSGAVSFMRIWDTMCNVLLSTGARRGAMMGVMRCDHPDIEEFITAKCNRDELRHFNVSVMVSDAFMQAVKDNAEWPLIFPVARPAKNTEIIYRQWGNENGEVACKVYRYVNARELWQKIIRSAYDYAEPGVLFGDTINRLNNLAYCEQINATNPCGEIPLPAYGACDLGAINLTQFVIAPFSENPKIDWLRLEETVGIATRFLDNVLDVSRYPLNAQKNQALGTRRIGLGITGLADMFVMLNIKYGSQASLELASQLMKRIANVTWYASIGLAREKGKFPFYKMDYLKGDLVQSLDVELQEAMARHGVRNSHHNTIAPAGTISLLANNISNGIEPIFQASYIRHMQNADSKITTFQVKDYAFHLWEHQKELGLPPAWMDTTTLTPDAHLNMQAAMQPYVDNAISKTINIPVDFPFADLETVYSQAYQLGLKGCTIFRPNPITGSVLEAGQSEEEAADRCCQFGA